MAERTKRRRNAMKNTLTKTVIQRIENLAEEDNNSEEYKLELAVCETTVTDILKEIKQFDRDIFDAIEDNEIECKTRDTVEFSSNAKKIVMKIRRKIEKLNSNTTNIVVSNGENASYQDRNTRLRRLNIKIFTGKPTEWPTFIESFETAVDSNGALSNIQNFQYLKSYLPGQVERCIEGFLLTNDNYREALNLLKERFGNTQLIINTHLSQLMKPGIVEEGNVSKLRNFFNTAESHTRTLSNQGVNKEHFGAILIPVIEQRIPYNVRVELSRKRGKDNWKLKRFLELLRIEIEARDKSKTAGNPHAKSKQEEPLTLQ